MTDEARKTEIGKTGFANMDNERFWKKLDADIAQCKGERISWVLAVKGFDEENTLNFEDVWHPGREFVNTYELPPLWRDRYHIMEWEIGPMEIWAAGRGDNPRFLLSDPKLRANLRCGDKLKLTGTVTNAEYARTLHSYLIYVSDYKVTAPN